MTCDQDYFKVYDNQNRTNYYFHTDNHYAK